MPIKYLRWAEIGLFVAGVVLWGLSVETGRAWMTTVGITSTGVALMLGGIMAMATGELTLWRGRYGVTRDRGLTARLFGLAQSLTGGALLAVAAARILGVEDKLGTFFSNRPGFAMVPIGVLLLAIGVANLIGAWNRRGSFLSFFQSLRNWAAGLFFLVIGVVLIGLGLFEVADPQAFDQLIGSFFKPLTAPDSGL
jgi:hypothetical protein